MIDLDEYPKVFIVVLNWNGKKDTIECLESLKQITYPSYEILLVDNKSTDGSVECFRKRYPEIETIENENNLGFAGGNNIGIKRAMENGADCLLILNNDTVVDKGILKELIEELYRDDTIGIVGPKIYYYDRPEILHMEKKYAGIESPLETFISGCCFLVKKNVFNEIGLLDDIFFLFFEETDFFLRARKKGYRTLYVPTKGKVLHKFSPSVSKLKNAAAYHVARSGMIFFRKHKSLVFKDYFFSTLLYSIIIRLNLKGLIYFVIGLNDGLSIDINKVKK